MALRASRRPASAHGPTGQPPVGVQRRKPRGTRPPSWSQPMRPTRAQWSAIECFQNDGLTIESEAGGILFGRARSLEGAGDKTPPWTGRGDRLPVRKMRARRRSRLLVSLGQRAIQRRRGKDRWSARSGRCAMATTPVGSGRRSQLHSTCRCVPVESGPRHHRNTAQERREVNSPSLIPR